MSRRDMSWVENIQYKIRRSVGTSGVHEASANRRTGFVNILSVPRICVHMSQLNKLKG